VRVLLPTVRVGSVDLAVTISSNSWVSALDTPVMLPIISRYSTTKGSIIPKKILKNMTAEEMSETVKSAAPGLGLGLELELGYGLGFGLGFGLESDLKLSLLSNTDSLNRTLTLTLIRSLTLNQP
jgi:hypothetical protein